MAKYEYEQKNNQHDMRGKGSGITSNLVRFRDRGSVKSASTDDEVIIYKNHKGVNNKNIMHFSSLKQKTKKKVRKFPNILMQILSERENNDIMTWASDGHSFLILRPERLVSKVLPKYFSKNCSVASFRRKLNRWGFKSTGQQGNMNHGFSASYYHEYFRRKQPGLCEQIRTIHKINAGGAVGSIDQEYLNIL
eukprot:CAMPEP_0195524506 /NCGR_PEP_ID=MMETSP0794_2-20130614/24391_1 /TAXON_ID=515487 /ORGANISM="Stephanopyxis turris, Strain CCMP 815" /LENGTH=192 /DNA_ID=CAMNT_0040654745 /DNA_START=188 /DNA_END=766 /DNA_ORIENTATION=-